MCLSIASRSAKHGISPGGTGGSCQMRDKGSQTGRQRQDTSEGERIHLTDNVARGPDVARRSLGRLIRHIRTLGDAASAEQSDAQFLARFAARRDEGAFTVLLERHGPMV